MAKKPADGQPTLKASTNTIGTYRVDGGRFASYDGEGRTKIITEAEAEAIGVRC
jgi:hypothetical protein